MIHPGIEEIVRIEARIRNWSPNTDNSAYATVLTQLKSERDYWYERHPKIKPKNVREIQLLEIMRAKSKYTIDWVSPEWEPITKIDEPWRCLYMFVLKLLALLHDVAGSRLGVLTVTWSECDPERAFLIYDEKIYQYNHETNEVVKK